MTYFSKHRRGHAVAASVGVRDSEGSHFLTNLPSGASVLFADWILEMVDKEEDDDLGSCNSSASSAILL